MHTLELLLFDLAYFLIVFQIHFHKNLSLFFVLEYEILFFLSLVYNTPEYKKVIKYEWEHPDFDAASDKFMQRFDENGNFVNLPIEKEESILAHYSANIPVEYQIIPNKENESKPEL